MSKKHLTTITVNGKEYEVPGQYLTYKGLISLLGISEPVTITYQQEKEETFEKGQAIKLRDKLVFTVTKNV